MCQRSRLFMVDANPTDNPAHNPVRTTLVLAKEIRVINDEPFA